jgi:hypothetical protein
VIRSLSLVPPAQGNNPRQSKAYALFTVVTLLAAMFPGALIGTGTAFVVWRTTKTDVVTRWLIARAVTSMQTSTDPECA